MPSNPFYLTPAWRALRMACLDRDHHRCVVSGCRNRATVADHIVTRPFVTTLCGADRLDNLRTLCPTHDAQVKEKTQGQAGRKNNGVFTIKGCDSDGWPLDPKRR